MVILGRCQKRLAATDVMLTHDSTVLAGSGLDKIAAKRKEDQINRVNGLLVC